MCRLFSVDVNIQTRQLLVEVGKSSNSLTLFCQRKMVIEKVIETIKSSNHFHPSLHSSADILSDFYTHKNRFNRQFIFDEMLKMMQPFTFCTLI